MHLLGDRVGDGAADAAADDADLLEPLHLGGPAERPDDVGNHVALFHGVEHFCRAARGLHHDGDRAALAVIARDGHRDALALLVQTEDHKLTGAGVPGDQRRFDLEQADALGVIQETLGYYLVHTYTSNIYCVFLSITHYCIF